MGEKTPGAQALKLINQYKVKYCQDLSDDKIMAKGKPKEAEKPKEKPKKQDKETPKKPDIIKEKLNDIKNLAIAFVNHCKNKDKLSAAEALKLTNTILKNHKVFEKAQKKKVVLPKKVCKDLKNNP